MGNNEQGTGDLLNRYVFETAVLKASSRFFRSKFQPLAWALIQTGEHFLQPRYRLLLLGGARISTPHGIDVDEFVSTLDTVLAKLPVEEPQGELAKVSVKRIRTEVVDRGAISFNFASDLFQHLMPYVQVSMNQVKSVLIALIESNVLTKEDAELVYYCLDRTRSTFLPTDFWEILKKRVRVTPEGRVVTEGAMAEEDPPVDMVDSGFFYIAAEPTETVTSPASIVKLTACGPPELQPYDIPEEVDVISTTPVVSLPGVSVSELETDEGDSAIGGVPEIEPIGDGSSSDDADGTHQKEKSAAEKRDEKLRGMLQRAQSSDVITIPLKEIYEMFEEMATMGIMDSQKLGQAKEELKRGAVQSPTDPNSPVVPLPTILDVFTRVLGAHFPSWCSAIDKKTPSK